MTLVVDASIAVKWFLVEPGDREALALLHSDQQLMAPDLIVPEVINVIWKWVLRGAIDASQANDVPGALVRIFPEMAPLAPLAARALKIAAELRHPVYDCFYLALAEERDARLVTADRRLIERLAGTAWQDRAVTLWN